ncbi:PucR family transcriptional regulator [Streptomyces sp. 4.24]|uniref:PucR family transcriptional regulator n=1 Tax=Streptomyces tritrimontium TaxID=3406573 RepID=UPI003BB70363
MRLRDLLSSEALPGLPELRLLGGGVHLDRPVLAAVTIDLPDPGRFVSRGDLVLSGLAWRRKDAGAGQCDAFVRVLVEAGCAALGAGEAKFGHVPADLVEACDRHGLPLLAVGVEVPFTAVTEYVARSRAGARVGNLAALVDRHRRFTADRQAGAGADALLELMLAELDLRAYILSPTGRQIAGARPPLPEKTASALAGRFLAAERAGGPAPHRTVARSTAYSLFPVRTGPDAGAAPTDWLIAVEADCADWGRERVDLVERLARLVAVERAGRDTDRTARRITAGRLLALLEPHGGGGPGGAGPGEGRPGAGRPGGDGPGLFEDAAARLATGAVGPEDSVRWQAVSARLDVRPAPGFPVGTAVRDLLEEVLLHPHCLGAGAGQRIAVAPAGEAGASGNGDPAGAEAVAFVLVGEDGELTPGAVGKAAGGSLPRALRAGERLSFGVSAPVGEASDLRHALAEARNARRVTAASDPVAACGPEDLAAHVMSLLALLPADVRRSFSRRLLSPLHDYDRRYRSDLVPTLRSFLEHEGSWARCGEALHLHVNSLRYRIGRIEALTGRSLTRLEDKMDFAAALRMEGDGRGGAA